MALISDGGNTRSTYPTTIDSFTAEVDGIGIESVTEAEVFNKLMTAILRIQEYTQKMVTTVGAAPFRIVRLSADHTLASPAQRFIEDFTLTAAQIAFLGDPYNQNTVYMANARLSGANLHYRAQIKPEPKNGIISVRVDHIDVSSAIAAGTIRVELTIMATAGFTTPPGGDDDDDDDPHPGAE